MAGAVIGERGPNWGADYGESGEIPPDAREARDDQAAAAIVSGARRAGRAIPSVVLTGGDLARTLGVGAITGEDAARTSAPLPADRRPLSTGPAGSATPSPQPAPRFGRGTRLAVDVGAALVDGRLHWFVAHLVARRSWWRGRLLVAANASFIGNWNVAPRSHPGDGRVDVFDADPPLTVRLAARRRLRAGTHVPHPRITQRRIAAAQYDLDPGLDVYLDGVRLDRVRKLSLRVEPGALEVWIPSGS